MRKLKFFPSPSPILFVTMLVGSAVFGADVVVAPDTFRKLHGLIKPRLAEENWIRIPWMTSLWDARVRAAAEGKPILLWEMDGHPLGCT